MQFLQTINPDVIAVAGTWDPPLPRHTALFRELIRYSKKKKLNPYVLVFYPNPANYRHENHYKDYFDLDARIALFKHLGINNVVVVDFTIEDLQRSVADFFDELRKSTGIVLNELWVGENQSLGAGPQGMRSIGIECSARNIKLRILKNSFLVSIDKDDVNRNFRAAKFDLTSAVVGYYPTYRLKAGLPVNIQDGVYNAKLRIEPFTNAKELTAAVTIKNGRLEEFERPSEYTWLVLSGIRVRDQLIRD